MLQALLGAESLAKDKKWEESYRAFNMVLLAEPENIRGLMGFGVVCFETRKLDEALEAFSTILRLKPHHVEALRSQILVLAASKMEDECLKALAAYMVGRDEEDTALAFAAQTYKELGRLDDAARMIDQALIHAKFGREVKYRDIRAEITGLPKPSAVRGRVNICCCCAPGMDGFIYDIIRMLEPYCRTVTCVSARPEDHFRAVEGADFVWLEWGNQLTQLILSQKNLFRFRDMGRGRYRQVAVRLHSYEIYDGLVEKIDFSMASDIVFVSTFMKELFLNKNIASAANRRLHVIRNGIDVKRFSFVPREPKPGGEAKIAFLGFISYKKDPMLMLHAFSHLAKTRPDLTLHVAGTFQDKRYEIGMPHFIEAAGLGDRVKFYGHISDADRWLADKDYILCSSLNESQGVGLLEAMSRGCRPLIYNFPGAMDLYPAEYLWTTFDDLDRLFESGPDPADCSAMVAEYYSKTREVRSWLGIILNELRMQEQPLPFNRPDSDENVVCPTPPFGTPLA
ncbi:MAG: glycosyltransferase [Deltaproteobacteria bacterium]|jgi:glycosyltransferase involved in cell wall biosynthesis|nr:glycosyltransferase [Deltaproteobacteria bacterium]